MALDLVLHSKIVELKCAQEVHSIQKRILNVAKALEEDSEIRLGYIDDWFVTKDSRPASLIEFSEILLKGYPMFKEDRGEVIISVASPEKGYWRLVINSIALFQIEDELKAV